MIDRPSYKDHPLWSEAMSLTREGYALADRVKEGDPVLALQVKKAAVAVPAQVAGALGAVPGATERRDHLAEARGALASLARHARSCGLPGSDELARRAELFDRSVLFELGAGEKPF
ncbi:MAG: four helix bundle protein [Thermoanaerobaculia bacterium]|nr:four helix bundle protein [Acidobacteriota bacterium]